MKKRSHQETFDIVFVSLLFVISIFVLFCLRTTATSEQDIIISPKDNIQHILNNANPNQTIYLSEGTYNQSFAIVKPITLTASSPHTTIINTTTLPNQPAIHINSDHVTIKNISLINTARGIYTTGIRITAEHSHIENCIIHHTPVGIAIWTSNNTITDTCFHHCADEGIVLLSTKFSACQYNTIKDCIFYDNCDAIELQQSCHNLIKNCTIMNNTHSGIDAIISDNNYNIISNCLIKNNAVHGIYLANSKHNIIVSCTLQNNTDGDLNENPPHMLTTQIIETYLSAQHEINQKTIPHNSTPVTSTPVLFALQQKIHSIRLIALSYLEQFIQH